MRTASLFKNGNNQAIRLPKDFEFEGVSEVEIIKDGDQIIIRPVRKTWASFAEVELADDDFLQERPDLVDTGRF
jgi:antitoxin VapB